MGAGFLIEGGILVAAAILALVLAHLALSHLVFVEERRKSALPKSMDPCFGTNAIPLGGLDFRGGVVSR